MSQTRHTSPELEHAAEIFLRVRPRLFGIAYRVLGGAAADAEDAVQETWLRWQRCDRSAVRQPDAFLATTVTRIAINMSQSARAKRETYVGQWLPEPVSTADDPTLGAARNEALSFAVLLLLERLTPTERAAYVLREAFDYPYPQIAEIVQTTPSTARQLVSRARRHLAQDRHASVDREHHRSLFGAFLTAARSGDVGALAAILADDVVSVTDGGGIHRTARRPILGRTTVARFLHGVSKWFWDDVTVRRMDANGHESALLLRDGTVFALIATSASADGITRIMWMMNPAKLSGVGGPAGSRAAYPAESPARSRTERSTRSASVA
jgi:RNA polymerase sigma-70 factor (ECF subfamily)